MICYIDTDVSIESPSDSVVTRTVLFFGDSNTRGYGVLPAQRFAAVVEAMLMETSAMRWRFVVASAASDFHAIPERIDAALRRYTPDVLVWQCPTGPASYFPRYPGWLAALKRVQDRFFAWRTARCIVAEIRGDPARQRTRQDALRDGRYIDVVYRYKLSTLPGMRQLRQRLIGSYGVTVKATRERYLELMSGLHDHVRNDIRAPIVFLGLLPLSDDVYPGYSERVADWNRHLARLLHHPEQGCTYLDLFESLTAGPHSRLCLNDGSHMSIDTHRRTAALIVPALRGVMEACECDSGTPAIPA